MTAELAVEQSAGSLAAERLGAETSERLRLERDILGLKSANTSLQQVGTFCRRCYTLVSQFI